MKKSNKRILSLLTAVCMILGMIVVPGGMTVANAANATNVSIPSVEKEYINNTFEPGEDGAIDTTGITFKPGNTDNVVEISGENGYLYLEKNGEGAPSITRTLTAEEVTPYIVVQAALASTNLSGASLKLTGTTETLSFVDVASDGKITSFGTDTGVTLAADGKFVTVTVSVDAAANTYSLWIGDVQAVKGAAISTDAFGSVTAMEIVLNGADTEAANLMVDDLKIYRHEPVLYYNDFNTNADGFELVEGEKYTSQLVTDGTQGYLSLSNTDGDKPVAYWNNGENAMALPGQFVVSFDMTAYTKWTNYRFYLVDEEGDKIQILWCKSDGGIKRYYLDDSGSSANNYVSFPLSTTEVTNYRSITMAFNMETKTYSYWSDNYNKDGIVEALDLKLPDTAGTFGTPHHIVMYSRDDKSAGAKVSIDNFAVYAGTAARTLTAEEIAGTAIPAAAETYVDNDFQSSDLTGLALTPNGSANKAQAYEPNHYLYIEQNNSNNYPYAEFDLSAVDSHYIVVSLDVATTKGGSPLYVTASDGTNTTTNLLRINADGEINIGGSGLGITTKIPTDGTFSHFDIVIDTEADTFTLWYNGKPCQWKGASNNTVYGLNGTTDFGMLKSLNFKAAWTTGTNNIIDNLKVYSYHVYDNDCDNTCNTCGDVREVAGHDWSKKDGICAICGTSCDPHGNGGNDHECDTCGMTLGECFEVDTKDHKCDQCGADMGEHKSNAAYACVAGKCDYCGADMPATADHDYTHDCDTTCNTCGATREVGDHVDVNPKDHVCDICTEIVGTHEPGDGKHTCDYCGGAVEGETCVDTDPADHKCDVCDETISQCSGGSATCTEQAVCTTCGQPYGELAAHVYKDGYCACGAKDPNAVFVAEVGNKQYTTLAAAIAAADAGSTVKLIGTVELDTAGVTVNKDLTIDLNGQTVNSQGDAFVCTAGTLTITGSGDVNAGRDANGSYVAVWANGGHVIINGGTWSCCGDNVTEDVNHQNDVIYTKNGGTVSIYGGHFKYTESVWTLNEHDTTGGRILVYGGTFEQFDPSNFSLGVPYTSHVADGYIAVEEDGVYTVQEGKWMADVGGERYHDLQEAVNAAAESGATVVLTENADKIVVPEGKTVAINFNGKTVNEIEVNGTLYGIDETTKNYTAEPVKVKITGTGTVASVHQVDTDGKDHTYAGYAADVDDECYATFNYFEVKISSVTLRPSEAGIGYKLYLAGNANVKAMLSESDAFGVTVYKYGDTDGGKSAKAGSASFNVGTQTKMVMIKNILHGDYSVDQNAANGNVKLCVSAYVNINGETVQIAYNSGKSLVDVFNSINDNLGSYNDVQKAALKTLYNTYIKANEQVFTAEGWKFDKIKEITDPAQN